MTRTCTVCEHPEIEEINKQLLAGGSYRDIAGQFGTSKSSLERHHKGGHILEAMTKAKGAEEEAKADKLLEDLKSVRTRTEELLKKAEAAGEIKAWPAFLRELREQIKLMGELEGRLAAQPQITIINNPQWIELRTVIIQALDPYPEAKEAVVFAIRGR